MQDNGRFDTLGVMCIKYRTISQGENMEKNNHKQVLGLDIGANSIGWALIRYQEEEPIGLIACGTRVFPMGIEIDPKSGKSLSLNTERRNARGRRRLLDRRQMRKRYILQLLQKHNLLPEGKPSYKDKQWKNLLLINPYELRVKALESQLKPYEFGRVILHLSQRRGFLSNRKNKSKEEKNKIKQETDLLFQEMQATGARTIGEYLAKMDPSQQRIRGRYTLRQWYKDEFKKIWDKQSQFLSLRLTDDLCKKIEHGLFYQRPLKSNKHLLGKCELEPNKHRANIALLTSQEFRMFQMLNNTLIFEEATGIERKLTAEEKDILANFLQKNEALKFSKAKKILKLKAGDTFNFENSGEEEFIGNTTSAAIIDVIGEDKWDALNEEEKKQMIEDLISIQNEETLIKRAINKWGLDEQTAEAFADIELEEGYLKLSTKAVLKLLPLMKQGLSYAEALKQAYPLKTNPPLKELLPPAENIRNPIVQRSLSELRKLVNAIIKRYGKPDLIKIELARELKQNSKQRELYIKKIRAREKERKIIIEKILNEIGIQNPTRRDIEKGLLWQECDGWCPYTGQKINFKDLFSEAPRFDVEHIIPFSRCLDDSFANKTLCEVTENRNVKQNKTPFEAYGSTKKWEEIIERVKKFKGEYRLEKIRRFMLKDIQDEQSFIEEFSHSQLNDTAYASRKAAEYLSQLYPYEIRKSAIQTTKGTITAYLRSAWGLNKILNSDGIKSRDDHRHHAIDAIVIALTTPVIIKKLAEQAKRTHRIGVFPNMPQPLPNFLTSVEQAIDKIVVSHYVDRSIRGALHEETLYGIIKTKNGEYRAVVRKKLSDISDVNDIVDEKIRQLVKQRLEELNLPPSKAFQEESNLPCLTASSGRKIIIRKARVFYDAKPIEIDSKKESKRYVKLGNNHHLEVFKCKDKKGNPTVRCVVVSNYEAILRYKNKEPIVRKADENGNPLLFSLVKGDAVKLNWKGEEVIAILQKLSTNFYTFRLHTDARPASKISYKETITITSDNAFYNTQCRKLSVDPIGNYHIAND